MPRSRRIIPTFLFGLLSLGFAVWLAPAGAVAATPTPIGAGALDARLGGTTATFAAAYGDPTSIQNGGDLLGYSVSGFGLVAAAFRDKQAYEITIAADRLDHNPLTEPDQNDWTVTDAITYAQAVVPADAAFGDPTNGKDAIRIAGHSAALESSFKALDFKALHVGGVPGDLALIFSLDTSGNVYAVDISVGNGEEPAAPSASAKTPAASASPPTPAASASGAGEVIHCRDFQTQAEAQSYFDAQGGDSSPEVAAMDGDRDGKACEILP